MSAAGPASLRDHWSEALAIEETHGAVAPAVIEERIRISALAGDEAETARWRGIAECYDQLQAAGAMRDH